MNEALYFERQWGSMCGQHCLNNLLQGPYFQAEDLAGIARELDEAEKELRKDDPEHMKQGSENVDDAGNFSIQVLSTALQRGYGLTLVQDHRLINRLLDELSKQDAAKGVEDFALVCNLQNHWFAIRTLHGEVWNLNSLLNRPKKISLFYLSAYLGQLREEGYSIFLVEGNLPEPLNDINMGSRQDWFVFGIDDVNVPEDPKRVSVHTVDEEEDQMLQAALKASMRESLEYRGSANQTNMDDDDDLQTALAMSVSASQPRYHREQEEDLDEEDDDEQAQLRKAIAMSKQMK